MTSGMVADHDSDMVVESDSDVVVESDSDVVAESDSDVQEVIPILSGDVLDLDDIPDGPSEKEEDLIPLKGNFLPTDRLTQADYGKLEPGKWLNDNLMDLFSR